MAYYHIDTIENYFHLLGFRGKANVHPQRQTVIADAFKDDNSFYSPATRSDQVRGRRASMTPRTATW